jgi:hypothetical protein
MFAGTLLSTELIVWVEVLLEGAMESCFVEFGVWMFGGCSG